MQLTQKETSLMKDLKGQEKLCIEKYNKHAGCAVDVQLKTLLNNIAGIEQRHYDMLVQIENGSVPQTGGGAQQKMTFTATYGIGENADKKMDSYICADLLATEKHASNLYDTCIFEFKDEGVRNVLNQIQKDEQNHGKQLYDYMAVNNMYS